MDTLFIRDFRADAWIGLYAWEKLAPQTLSLELTVGLDTHAAGASDDLGDTIDYGAVIERIRADLKDRHFKLLEALAEHVAHVVLHDFGAGWVKVSVAKLAHLRGVGQVGVTIARNRDAAGPLDTAPAAPR
ncbi:MAG: dihydroneopterin aldolase [Betaproteobacteria bacterium]|nr:dihydroneopterin aldolase [Betaproteobacteria bacterium]